jgi:hypothetical protein
LLIGLKWNGPYGSYLIDSLSQYIIYSKADAPYVRVAAVIANKDNRMTETPKVAAALLVGVAVDDGGGALVDASPPGTTTGVGELTSVVSTMVPSSGRAVVVVISSLPLLNSS